VVEGEGVSKHALAQACANALGAGEIDDLS
jgi:hypothetical protein